MSCGKVLCIFTAAVEEALPAVRYLDRTTLCGTTAYGVLHRCRECRVSRGDESRAAILAQKAKKNDKG